MTHPGRRKLLRPLGLAAIFAVGLAACGDDDDDSAVAELTEVTETATEDDAATEDDGATADDASGAGDGPVEDDDLSDLTGEQVEIEGEVTDLLDNAALVDTDRFGEVLVVEAGFDAAAGDVVAIEGDVEEFELDDFESQLALDFDPDEFGEFEGEPVVVVSSIEVVEPLAPDGGGDDAPDEEFELPEEG